MEVVLLLRRVANQAVRSSVLGLVVLAAVARLAAHESTAHQAARARARSLAAAAAGTLSLAVLDHESQTCRLAVRLVAAETGQRIPALVRVTDLASGKAVPLPGEIMREANWYSVRAESKLTVPRGRLRIEAFAGLHTRRKQIDIDVSGKAEADLEVPLARLYDPQAQGWFGGNTHLHLLKLSMPEALEYLQLVPRTDGLDVVFLSHLRRIPDERDYISNQIVEDSFVGGQLQRLSQAGTVFGNGQEHRHNYGRGGEGYGHVMLLDLVRLIQPVSIGPGIMAEGADAPPLRRGIRAARSDGGTVIWCHNSFGLEDLPNWAAGEIHAQNIFDGGSHGSYEDTFYRYLNLGWHVPFSTGTDWFIYDFSRVFVPVRQPLTTKSWLAELRAGRSYITNGTFLEFTVNDRPIGDVLQLDEPSKLAIRGFGTGRNDFRGLELVHNGRVIHQVAAKATDDVFRAELIHELSVAEPGWLALRIPLQAGQNEFGKPLFAHTSVIRWQYRGRTLFRADVARQLLAEMEANVGVIGEKSRFATDAERDAVLQAHRAGIAALRRQLEK